MMMMRALGGEQTCNTIKIMGKTYRKEKSWGKKISTRSRKQRHVEEESSNTTRNYDNLDTDDDDEEEYPPRPRKRNQNNF